MQFIDLNFLSMMIRSSHLPFFSLRENSLFLHWRCVTHGLWKLSCMLLYIHLKRTCLKMPGKKRIISIYNMHALDKKNMFDIYYFFPGIWDTLYFSYSEDSTKTSSSEKKTSRASMRADCGRLETLGARE